jgi:hypothetical protein
LIIDEFEQNSKKFIKPEMPSKGFPKFGDDNSKLEVVQSAEVTVFLADMGRL